MLDKLLQQHTENLTKNFQTQLQTLQDKVSQPPPPEPPVYHPVVPPKNWGELRNYHEGAILIELHDEVMIMMQRILII